MKRLTTSIVERPKMRNSRNFPGRHPGPRYLVLGTLRLSPLSSLSEIYISISFRIPVLENYTYPLPKTNPEAIKECHDIPNDAIRWQILDFLSDGNSNVCSISDNLQDIRKNK